MVYMYIIEFHTIIIFTSFPCSFRPPSRALVAYHKERSGMALHDVVGINCEQGTTTDIKVQVPSVWTQGCMLDNDECII